MNQVYIQSNVSIPYGNLFKNVIKIKKEKLYFLPSHFTKITTGLLYSFLLLLSITANGQPFAAEQNIGGNFTDAYSVYATDLDGDGDVDVLGAALSADEITWWENDGNQVFTQHIISGTFDGAYSVYATDVDGDGDVDVLGAAFSAKEITWWENDGSQSFTEHTISGNFDGAVSVYAADVDGDGDVDVLGAASTAKSITWWENNGSQSFTEHTINGNFDGAISVFATDVDGDGDVDILGAGYLADAITWWENTGSQSFTEHTIHGNFDGAFSVYATDLDGDGDVDVLGAAFFADDITWWENDGNQAFTEHTISADFGGAASVYATDVNGDGHIDVLGAAFFGDEIAWWENDGSEAFTKNTISGTSDGAHSVYATDLDGDGDVDILGAVQGTNEINWWENETLIPQLPVELISFEARPYFGDVLLEWQTASEKDNKGFEVQHSSNGYDWKMIDFVEGKGNAVEVNDYRLVHPKPNQGINYYRLKQVDFDDAFEYSNTRAVQVEDDDDFFSFFPNPANRGGSLQWHSNVKTSGTISIFSITGQQVRLIKFDDGSQVSNISLSSLPSGIYTILVETNQQSLAKRLIID